MTPESEHMSSFWRTALWQQLGAALGMLENALLACPDTHWHGRLWSAQPPQTTEFWYVTYHALFWFDLYLTGTREGFAPPAPFTLVEIDPEGVLPEQPYTRDELHTYLDIGSCPLLVITSTRCKAKIGGT